MEQKKLLWVVASVGLFLLVVIGSALLLYTPKPTTDNALTSLESNAQAWVKGAVDLNTANTQSTSSQTALDNYSNPLNVGQDSNSLDNSSIRAENLTVYATNTNVYPNNQADISSENNGKTVINLTVKADADLLKPQETKAEAPKTEPAKSTASNKEVTKPATTSTASTSKTTATSSTTKTTVAKTTTKSDKLPDQWWVQVASPTNKQSAEDVRSMLSAQKINSEVFTYNDTNNILHYRVRVGPYTTEGEAAYWCKIVKETGNFKDAYISNSTAKKS